MTKRYVWSDEVEAINVDSEWVILHMSRQTVTKVNEIGGTVWTCLREEITIDSILDVLEKDYEITREQAHRDVEAFIHELEQSGLIVWK